MKCRWHCCKDPDPQLIKLLHTAGIPYREIDTNGQFITVPSEHADVWGILFYLPYQNAETEHILRYAKRVLGTEYVEVSYSQAELNRAQWLMLQPRTQKATADENAQKCSYEYLHGWHETQIGDLVLCRDVKWTKTIFFTCFDNGDETILVNSSVQDAATEASVSGVQFRQVWRTGGVLLKNTVQLCPEHLLPADCMLWDAALRRRCCPVCGEPRYCPEQYALFQPRIVRGALNPTLDMYITPPILGDGGMKLYLISQRFYQLLRQQKMTGHVAFTPVILEP